MYIIAIIYIFFRHMQQHIISNAPKISPANAAKTSITKALSESSFENNFSLSHSGWHVPFFKTNWSLQFTCTALVVIELLLNEEAVSDHGN